MHRRTAILAVFSVVTFSQLSAHQKPTDGAFRVEPITSPAGAASGQPRLSVSPRGVLLSWVERSGRTATLKFAERTASGWTPVRTVASGDNWFVNWADVPSVVRLPSGTLVGHWLQKSGPGTYAYDVRLAYSADNGLTFSPSFLPHHDGTQTEHGFASLFPYNGGLGLVWLDGRQTHAGPQGPSGHNASGAMTVRFAAFDGRWKQVSDLPVDTRVCDCCPTTAAMTTDGPIVAFRDRSNEDIRDIHVSRFERGAWTASKPVANDNWHITGCPVNGPMLSAKGRDVVLTWFTGADNQPRALAAFSNDGGRTFGKPIRIDDSGTLGRVDASLIDDDSAVIAWIEHAGGKAEFKIRKVDRAGNRSASTNIAGLSSDRTSGYPRIGRHGNELVAAWVEQEAASPGTSASTRVRTAVVRLGVGR